MTDGSESPAFTPVDPFDLMRREKAATQIRRSYDTAGVAPHADGYAVLLDGRPVRTPGRRELVVPGHEIALALAEEWNRQGPAVLPSTMPMSRLVNTALDAVVGAMAEVQAEIVKYSGSDLLCYRAAEPDDLVARQAAAWDPVLAWGREALGARFVLARGVMFVAQPAATLEAVRRALAAEVGSGPAAPFRLSALHVMTTMTGSALLALAVSAGLLTAADAWTRAHIDEDFQIEQWGADEEAAERRGRRWSDMEAAARLAAPGRG